GHRQQQHQPHSTQTKCPATHHLTASLSPPQMDRASQPRHQSNCQEKQPSLTSSASQRGRCPN
ncbi:hypothetical protein M9458_046958, partial [Cirrhinus mrigala]